MEINVDQLEAIVVDVMNKMNNADNKKWNSTVNLGFSGSGNAAPSKMGTVDLSNAVAKPKYTATVPGQEAFGTGGNEPFDIEYPMMDPSGNTLITPYPRIVRMIKRVSGTVKAVETERAMIYTEAYKKYIDDPIIIKRAKCFAEVLNKITLRLLPDELLVGDSVGNPRSAAIFPEFSIDWIVDEMEAGVWQNRSNDVFDITEHDKNDLRELKKYWSGRTHMDNVIDMLSDEQKKGGCLSMRPIYFEDLIMKGHIGHCIPKMSKILTVGWIGLKQEIFECLSKLDESTAEGLEKREFYIAQLIVLQGVKDYHLRYAAFLREEARKPEYDAQRKQEIITMADNMEWNSENPPRTYYEAMQLWWTVVSLINAECNGQGISFGRPDRFMLPFYEKDMKEGRITKWFVGELAEALYIKIHEQMKLRDEETCALNSEIGIGGPMVLVGGTDETGADITNDLSYIFLEAMAHTQLPDPWMACRWGIKAPWEFKVKTVNTIKVGTSQPKLFNDESIILALLKGGRTLDEARDYSVSGCVEINTGGADYSMQDAAYFNMAKVLELAINNGICIDCNGKECPRYDKCVGAGKTHGIDTGSLADFKTFDEVKEAYRKQMEYWVKQMCGSIIACDLNHGRNNPLPYLSLLIDDCIQNGKDVTRGGSRYHFSGPQSVSIGTVADSLSSIDTLIFKEKKVTGTQMLNALKVNWVGHEQLHALVNSEAVPHYGNDNDYVDYLARFGTDCFMDELDKYTNARGGKFQAGLYSVSGNVGIGLGQGATPDGRTAGEAVSNCVGPVQTKLGGCHDVKGPLAVIHSAAKLDHQRAGNGTLLNIRFTPSCISGDTGRDNFIAFIDDYFMRRGTHVQFNIVNTDVLIDAQKHPEKYPTLLVRVAGYSAYFTRLSKELQDDLIGRNSYDSFD